MKKLIQVLKGDFRMVILLILVGCNNVVRVDEQEEYIFTDADLNSPENYKGIETCEEGKELARNELDDGELKYIFGSYGSKTKLAKKLQELYRVEIIETDGLLGIPNHCYNDVMYKEIQKRYGQDAFTKALED